MIESSLENISVAIGRFSTMGYLQAVLEAQSMCDNFSKSRKAMIEALQNLAESRLPVCPFKSRVLGTILFSSARHKIGAMTSNACVSSSTGSVLKTVIT